MPKLARKQTTMVMMWVKENHSRFPDLTIKQMQEEIKKECGVIVNGAQVRECCQDWDLAWDYRRAGNGGAPGNQYTKTTQKLEELKKENELLFEQVDLANSKMEAMKVQINALTDQLRTMGGPEAIQGAHSRMTGMSERIQDLAEKVLVLQRQSHLHVSPGKTIPAYPDANPPR